MSDILERLRVQEREGLMFLPHDFKVVSYGDAANEITRLRTALSEAEQRVTDAKRIATNAEHYGYLHGLEKAAAIADEHAKTWGLANGSPAKVISAAIRALIPSEPHDAESRETTRRGDPSIFDDAEGRN